MKFILFLFLFSKKFFVYALFFFVQFFLVEVVVTLALMAFYLQKFFKSDSKSRPQYYYVLSITGCMLFMTVSLLAFFCIAVATGGDGVPAYIPEILTIFAEQMPVLVALPCLIRWMNIVSKFFDTPFAQKLQKFTWAKSRGVRIAIIVQIVSVSIINFIIAIICAIPEDSSVAFPNQQFPYYESIRAQAAIWGLNALILFGVILFLSVNVIHILRLSEDSLKNVRAVSTNSEDRAGFLRVFKIQTWILSVLSLIGYPATAIVDLVAVFQLTNMETSHDGCFVVYGSLWVICALVVIPLHYAAFLDLKMISFKNPNTVNLPTTDGDSMTKTPSTRTIEIRTSTDQ